MMQHVVAMMMQRGADATCLQTLVRSASRPSWRVYPSPITVPTVMWAVARTRTCTHHQRTHASTHVRMNARTRMRARAHTPAFAAGAAMRGWTAWTCLRTATTRHPTSATTGPQARRRRHDSSPYQPNLLRRLAAAAERGCAVIPFAAGRRDVNRSVARRDIKRSAAR